MAEIHVYPEHPVYEIDKLDQKKQYYIGFWRANVSMPDGTIRNYLSYVPENAKRDANCCLIAVPSGVESTDFLEKTGWRALADQENLVLTAFEPKDGKWGNPAEESKAIAFLNRSLRNYTPFGTFDWRYCGYGDGGAALELFLMNEPLSAAAAVIVHGSTGLEESRIEQIGQTHFRRPKGEHSVTYGETPQPIWLVEEPDAEKPAALAYWKKANDVLERTEVLLDNITVWRQDPYSNAVISEQQPKVGIVRYQEKPYEDCLQAAYTEELYAFLRVYSKCGAGSPYSNALSYACMDRIHFDHKVEIVDGWQREWYVYCPPGFDAKKESLPLVVFFHGTHQSGLVAIRQSGWWKVAKEKRFLVAFPSATLENLRTPGRVPGMSWNLENYGNADDIVFVRHMVKRMIEQYNADAGRIYASGQSNGGRMAIYCALAMPDVFAASASMGATNLGPMYDTEDPDGYPVPENTISEYTIPVMNSMGGDDIITYQLDVRGSDSWKRCHYFCDRAGMDYDKDRFHCVNGRYVNDIWIDDQKIPMLRQTVVDKRAHHFNPMETEMTWNEWFSLFSKEPETGRVIYMGKIRK